MNSAAAPAPRPSTRSTDDQEVTMIDATGAPVAIVPATADLADYDDAREVRATGADYDLARDER